MNESILVSKKHGVNPTILICEWCGKNTNALALLGRCSKLKCNKCGATVYGTLLIPCPACGYEYRGKGDYSFIEADVEAPREISRGLCDDCMAKKTAVDNTVKEGGIYMRCKNCGTEGAIKAENQMAIEVRKKLNIQAPDPCGLEITSCPVCDKSGN